MLDVVIPFSVGCALGFGYAVRERVSRSRHRRHRKRIGY
jgi:hypothetical protein